MLAVYKNLYLPFWSFILGFFCYCKEWIINILTKILFELAHGWWRRFFFLLYSRFNYYNGSYKSSIECSACYMGSQGSTKCCGFYNSSKNVQTIWTNAQFQFLIDIYEEKYWKYNCKPFKKANCKEFMKQLNMHFSNIQQSWKQMQNKWNKMKEKYEFERDKLN